MLPTSSFLIICQLKYNGFTFNNQLLLLPSGISLQYFCFSVSEKLKNQRSHHLTAKEEHQKEMKTIDYR